MIDRNFWEEARKAWVVIPPPQIKTVKTGSGGAIDPSFLKDPWDSEEVPFDAIDYDAAVMAVMNGGEISVKIPQEQPSVPKKPKLDKDKFDEYMSQQDMPGYIGACRLLLSCDLPDKMDDVYGDLIEQMRILEESLEKFKDVYRTDLDQFYEYYIPEALQLTATYLEYIEIGIDGEIVRETEAEVMQALEKLLLAMNEKKDEIYKFASIELKAKAKALESLMSQDGFVDPAYKIRKGGD